MTTDVKALFIDANILLYSMNVDSPFHHDARRALQHADQRGIETVISTQILREFYGISSRSGKDGHQVDTAPILESIQAFRESFRVLDDNSFVSVQLFGSIATTTYVGGRQIHDANIVATMLTYRITHLLTNNPDDFARFADLITVIPLLHSHTLLADDSP